MTARKKSVKSKSGKPADRVQRSKDAVLAVTYELLSEKGLSGATVDEISLRSGVAKTTIYRHWPTGWALLLDACSKVGPQPEIPETGSLREDISALATFIAKQLRTNRMSSVLPSILDAAERDTDIGNLHAQMRAAFVGPFERVFEAARQRGELPRGTDTSEIIASILGPLFYRRWFSREPLDQKFVKGVVERAMPATK